MSLPDLNTDEGRAAYRKELRQVGRPLRFTGLALIVAAAVVVFWPTGEGGWPPIQQLTLAAIATIFVLASVWLRDLGWLLRAKPQA